MGMRFSDEERRKRMEVAERVDSILLEDEETNKPAAPGLVGVWPNKMADDFNSLRRLLGDQLVEELLSLSKTTINTAEVRSLRESLREKIKDMTSGSGWGY